MFLRRLSKGGEGMARFQSFRWRGVVCLGTAGRSQDFQNGAARQLERSGYALYVMLLPNSAIRRPPAIGARFPGGAGSGLRRAADMCGAAGLRQHHVFSVCGKVPYRLSDGFRPVRRFRDLGAGPGLGQEPECPYKSPYKDKGFELSRPANDAHQRKRKREGLSFIFGSARSGCTGSPLTERESVFVQ
jgi:hypothetical protein